MDKLTDENKRVDVLMKIYEEGWKNFDRRRAYEWKLSLAIWTALAAFIALAMRGEVSAIPLKLQPLFGVLALGIVGLHFLFERRVKLANDVDKRRAEICEDPLYDAAGLVDRKRLQEAIDKVTGNAGWWSSWVRVGITVLLMIAAAAALNLSSKKEITMADYIPAPDADFHAWQLNFVSYANANLGALGLVAGDLTPITTAQSTWGIAYPAHVSAQQNAQGATQTKKDARSAYVAALRPLVKRLQASAAVDAAERANLGITVPDTEPTPTGPPTTAPLGKIDCGQRLLHTVHFMDETTPTSKSKPAGGRSS